MSIKFTYRQLIQEHVNLENAEVNNRKKNNVSQTARKRNR